MSDKPHDETDGAGAMLAVLRDSLESARRLVGRTRFLLAGDPLAAENELVISAEAQAAAPATSETVQNPSGE